MTRALRPEETCVALQYLLRAPRLNLMLLDRVLQLAEHAGVALPAPAVSAREFGVSVVRETAAPYTLRAHEDENSRAQKNDVARARETSPWRSLYLRLTSRAVRPELLAYWRGAELVALAQVQPSLLFSAGADERALEVFLPHLNGAARGLVRGRDALMRALAERLAARGQHALLSRVEFSYVLEATRAARTQLAAAAHAQLKVRAATHADLDALVLAARGSLRAEARPDPAALDPRAFRRWVRGRIARATVGVCAGTLAFAGYSDVTRTCGWLLQGIFTAPRFRQRGFARAGVAAMCLRAFDAGAAHVQLSVVENNAAGVRLYESLGFARFATQRALLFG